MYDVFAHWHVKHTQKHNTAKDRAYWISEILKLAKDSIANLTYPCVVSYNDISYVRHLRKKGKVGKINDIGEFFTPELCELIAKQLSDMHTAKVDVNYDTAEFTLYYNHTFNENDTSETQDLSV